MASNELVEISEEEYQRQEVAKGQREALRKIYAEHNLDKLMKEKVQLDVETGKGTVIVTTPDELLQMAATFKALGFEADNNGSTMNDYDTQQGSWGVKGRRPTHYGRYGHPDINGDGDPLVLSHVLASVKAGVEKHGASQFATISANAGSIELVNNGGDSIGKVELPLAVELDESIIKRALLGVTAGVERFKKESPLAAGGSVTANSYLNGARGARI